VKILRIIEKNMHGDAYDKCHTPTGPLAIDVSQFLNVFKKYTPM
jgi:hypothetical protein